MSEKSYNILLIKITLLIRGQYNTKNINHWYLFYHLDQVNMFSISKTLKPPHCDKIWSPDTAKIYTLSNVLSILNMYLISAHADGGPRSPSAHAWPFARPPISMSGNFPAHVSAESPPNISPNPSEVIPEVSESYNNFWKYPPLSAQI